MSKTTPARTALTQQATRALQRLGEDLRAARKARKWGLREAASRLFVSVTTLRRLESGHPGVSTGVLSQALFVYGLVERLGWVANPAFDMKRLGERLLHSEESEFDV